MIVDKPGPEFFKLLSWQQGPRLMLSLHRETGTVVVDWDEVQRTANDETDQARFMAKALLAVRLGAAVAGQLN